MGDVQAWRGGIQCTEWRGEMPLKGCAYTNATVPYTNATTLAAIPLSPLASRLAPPRRLTVWPQWTISSS